MVKEKQQQVYQSLVRQLDTWENECIPKVSMSTNTVHFSNVTFQSPITETVVIENTGQVVVQFQFIPKLQVNPYFFVIFILRRNDFVNLG